MRSGGAEERGVRKSSFGTRNYWVWKGLWKVRSSESNREQQGATDQLHAQSELITGHFAVRGLQVSGEKPRVGTGECRYHGKGEAPG